MYLRSQTVLQTYYVVQWRSIPLPSPVCLEAAISAASLCLPVYVHVSWFILLTSQLCSSYGRGGLAPSPSVILATLLPFTFQPRKKR